MKTTIDLEPLTSSVTPHVAARARPATPLPTTVRLGLILSVLAALAAVALSTIWHVPTVVILVGVVLVGFTLSWRAAGRPIDEAQH
ncbi:MAG: hypothetical protein ACR2HQ_09385 [Ilumatobacteraceae bacterium]